MTKEQKEQDYKRVYLDANVFIYSILNEFEIGEKARKIIADIKDSVYDGFTSLLTIDEILWKIQKDLGKEKAANIAEEFISLQNLEFVDVNIDIIREAIRVYKEYGLDPRDAIHLAAMKSKNIKIIFSADSDFDKMKEIKRIDFTK